VLFVGIAFYAWTRSLEPRPAVGASRVSRSGRLLLAGLVFLSLLSVLWALGTWAHGIEIYGRFLLEVVHAIQGALRLPLATSQDPRVADALKSALAKVQGRYEDTKTMEADFKQTVESPTLATPLKTSGKVAFEKPNHTTRNTTITNTPTPITTEPRAQARMN